MKKLKLEELGRISIDEFKETNKIPVTIVLDNVRSMHNVGSVFRTADAFRVEQIFLTGITATPPHREIHKTALGATDSVKWGYAKDPVVIIKQLKAEGYQVVVIEQTSSSVELQKFSIDMTKKYCLVFGNEVSGVSESIIDLCDHAIEIPQSGTKHSLNISVCAGVVIWEFFQRLRQP